MNLSVLSPQSLLDLNPPIPMDGDCFALGILPFPRQLPYVVGRLTHGNIHILHLSFPPDDLNAGLELLRGVEDYGVMTKASALHCRLDTDDQTVHTQYDQLFQMAGWHISPEPLQYFSVAKGAIPLHKRGGDALPSDCQIVTFQDLPWELRIHYQPIPPLFLDFREVDYFDGNLSQFLVRDNCILGYTLFQNTERGLTMTQMVWPQDRSLTPPLASATSMAIQNQPSALFHIYIRTKTGEAICKKWLGTQILSTHYVYDYHLNMEKG